MAPELKGVVVMSLVPGNPAKPVASLIMGILSSYGIFRPCRKHGLDFSFETSIAVSHDLMDPTRPVSHPGLSQ
jgi:hypothetical protein